MIYKFKNFNLRNYLIRILPAFLGVNIWTGNRVVS